MNAGRQKAQITDHTEETHHCFLVHCSSHQLPLGGRQHSEIRLHFPQLPLLAFLRSLCYSSRLSTIAPNTGELVRAEASCFSIISSGLRSLHRWPTEWPWAKQGQLVWGRVRSRREGLPGLACCASSRQDLFEDCVLWRSRQYYCSEANVLLWTSRVTQ